MSIKNSILVATVTAMLLIVTSSGIVAAQDGGEIYDSGTDPTCVSCHADDGTGTDMEGQPDLTNADFWTGEDKGELEEHVKEGGALMPAMEDQLTEDELTAVLTYTASFADVDYVEDVPDTAGEKIFESGTDPTCVSCHAEDGTGTGMEGQPDLTNADFWTSEHKGELEEHVKEGGALMPAMEDQLTYGELQAVLTYTASLADVDYDADVPDEGRQIYNEGTDPTCVSCHAEDGTGTGMEGQPDLTNADFWTSEHKGELEEHVKEGGNLMPAMEDQLTEAELEKVLTYTARLANVDYAADVPDTAGQKIYESGTDPTCVSCHAEDGTGTGMEGQPDLTNADFWTGEDKPELEEHVKEGGNLMPAMEDQLSEEQLQSVLTYTASFADVDYAADVPDDEGEKLYMSGTDPTCVSCHADDGSGTGMEGQPDFNNASFWTSEHKAELREFVEEGGGEMPGLGDQLTEEELTAVLEHETDFAGVAWEDVPEESTAEDTAAEEASGDQTTPGFTSLLAVAGLLGTALVLKRRR